METKRCKKCGEVKSLSAFHKNPSSKDGVRSTCKKCKYAQDKKYRESNRDRIKRNNKLYKEANKEKFKEYRKEYRKKNSKKLREYYKKYVELNREKRNESIKKWKRNNSLKMKIINKKHYEKNHEKIRSYAESYREKNHEKLINKKRKDILNLNDNYICSLLNVGINDIPKELIEAKKAQLQLKRALKEF